MRMLYIEKTVNDFISKLNKSDYFKDKIVLHSYPSSHKYTLLKKPIIAVSFKEINVNESAVGENFKAGTYCVCANIYIPFLCNNISAEEIVSEICKSVDDFDIVGIKVSKTIVDSLTECYVTETEFTFNGEVQFGGATYE